MELSRIICVCSCDSDVSLEMGYVVSGAQRARERGECLHICQRGEVYLFKRAARQLSEKLLQLERTHIHKEWATGRRCSKSARSVACFLKVVAHAWE